MLMRCVLALGAAMSFVMPAMAQWDPGSGEWGKSDARDVRVMTWNVQDGICSSNDKTSVFASDWNAIVHVIAAMRPDVLIMQECGDNSGNGTGSGLDSEATLENVCELMMHGGADPYLGGSVASYVQLYTGTGYDLPYIYVAENNDGFNRNVIMSRFEFADLNTGGDRFSNYVLQPDEYQSGGTSGIRGFMFAEIDLPDGMYAGDLVVGNCHLKAGGSSSDFDQREAAARNAAYFMDYYYNGAGTGVSDPNSRIVLPTVGEVLDENTPIVWGGDFNQTPGGFGPAQWMTRAEFTGGTDGTDRDRTDSMFDGAFHPLSFEVSTQGSSSKLDYMCWQDSIATARREFIFRSSGSNVSTPNLPEPVRSYPSNPAAVSSFASDHRPVIVDFILPEPAVDPCPAPPDFVDDDSLDFFDLSAFLTLLSEGDMQADLNDDMSLDFFDVSAFLQLLSAGCP